ncbi:hypothetical protein CPC08DRAFT_21888 [Agrocybe pediades]|nr:hypothetical protein CPC08DRAFT_21888 [Agrocybe pediades]
MRGHKKTNCMSLPNANFLPKSERTPTPPLPAPPPPVEQAHTVAPITSYSFANTTMAPSAFDMSQGSDYTYNQSYMPNAFQASYASSSSSAVAPFDPAATFYPHIQVPMAPNMGGMAMLGDNGAFPGPYYGLQSHMHEQSGMSTSTGYPPHEPHHQESFGILPDTPYLADDAAPNPYNYNNSPLTNPHMLSYDSGFFQ